MSNRVPADLRLTTLPSEGIGALLSARSRADEPLRLEMAPLFSEILRVANQFVPSAAGSVLLDDPSNPAELVFVACYGEKSDQLVGRRMPSSEGLVGKCYRSGKPVLSSDAAADQSFYDVIDKETSYTTRSVVCVPIELESTTCGVLELLNRHGVTGYAPYEVRLLQIFADYISGSLQRLLDAQHFRELAKHDDLTGLFNDRYFHERLSDEVSKAEEESSDLCLVFLDLDDFKSVNDRHGHLIGSETLRQVGYLLARTVAKEHAVAARYGGDEFVIIAPRRSLAEGLRLAERVAERMRNSAFRIDPGDESGVWMAAGSLTASFGVASYRGLALPSSVNIRMRKNDLVRNADAAMYRAKALGKNRVCSDSAAPRGPRGGGSA